jgi:hypothetical protein
MVLQEVWREHIGTQPCITEIVQDRGNEKLLKGALKEKAITGEEGI